MKKTIHYLAILPCFILGSTFAYADCHQGYHGYHGHHGHHGCHGQHDPHLKSGGETDGNRCMPMHEKMFSVMDMNGDGAISNDEFHATHENRFKVLDVNGDGKITPDEMRGMHRGMKGGDTSLRKMDEEPGTMRTDDAPSDMNDAIDTPPDAEENVSDYYKTRPL